MSVRTGVFVCHCGTNIGGIINVPEVVEYARTLPNVVFSEENLYTCSEDGLSSIRNNIKEYDLNRVVVASCTPRTHEPLFRQNCVLAGLNKYLFEFVNLREHCSWVHMERHDDATIKAKDLVRMGAAKVALLTPQDDLTTDVMRACLVIGGGISGLSATLTLANQGYHVELVEKKDRLGGLLKDINRIFPSNEPTSQFLDPLISSVSKHENINVHLESELVELKGFIGNFTVKLKNNSETDELKTGTIIVSTGAEELKPMGSFGYDRFDNVMTQLEFERKYKQGYDGLNRVVMINCVGARIEEREYCGRFCCITGRKNAILIKEENPGAEVSILQRDIMACGKVFEDYYRKALDMGIRFIRYNVDRPPEIAGSGNMAGKVKVYHELMGRDIELEADIVLLTTPLIPGEDNQQLSRMMKIPVGNDGFFLEAHQKLRPVEFPSDGIFIAGCARYPTDISECISQGYAAAAKAAIPMAQGRVITDAFISEVNPLRCSACGRCVDICPFGAINWADWKGPKGENRSVASINAAECKGCGLCVSSCLSGAIDLKGFTDEEILAMVNTVIDSTEGK
ncbi:MAG: CoB--CoM heterodisulfide reductase iron-sulfur subunit A family protein [Deltaproteobacteria bacterium]|nr:CoB--CoM heterodisulfide reductase iron-sulfur subunit A family protein [Deltaproteobacteria bacterium]